MASGDTFVLRVVCRKGENTDWRVPCQIAFRDVLVGILLKIYKHCIFILKYSIYVLHRTSVE